MSVDFQFDRKFCDSMLDLNAKAFTSGHIEVAYHLLMVVIHGAVDTHDVDLLEAISTLADSQQSTLDADMPEHRLATKSAAKQGKTGIFTLAGRQAHTQVLIERRKQIKS